MKLERMTLYHLRMPLITPFETSFGRIVSRECILISIDSEGLTGYGECVADHDPGYSYETVGTAWHIISEFMAPAVLGYDIDTPGWLQQRLSSVRGHHMAKAGIEMALWDLFGKRDNCSLREILGGVHDRVKVGVSVGIQDSPQSLAETVAEYLERGYQRIKIKIKPGRDIEETREVRRVFPDIMLQVDANSAYTLESAQSLLPLDELGLLLIEQPLAEDDLWDHSRLQESFKTPLCLDESILSMRQARQSIEMGACRVINIKAGRVGGLSEAVAIHDLCQSMNVPVWCGGMLETGVGRASNLALASLPGFSLPGDISASDRYYPQDVTHQTFQLNDDSTINVPDAPGLGVTIDFSALQSFTENRVVLRLTQV